MKHTQGKWTIEKIATDLEVAIYAGNNKKRICEVKSFTGTTFNDPTKEEADANAKLISAAPDLLEALKLAKDLLEEHLPLWYLRNHYNKIQHSIDKATK